MKLVRVKNEPRCRLSSSRSGWLWSLQPAVVVVVEEISSQRSRSRVFLTPALHTLTPPTVAPHRRWVPARIFHARPQRERKTRRLFPGRYRLYATPRHGARGVRIKNSWNRPGVNQSSATARQFPINNHGPALPQRVRKFRLARATPRAVRAASVGFSGVLPP